MKKKSLIIFIPLLLLLSSLSIENPIEKIIAGFKKYIEELPQEKVYIQLDRPYYASGDHLWFKAYLTAGTLHEPSPLSRTLYVELWNQNKEIIKQYKFLVSNGSVGGDFELPDSLATGNYLLRAYTNWMHNFDENYFFHHEIKIWNLSTNKSVTSNKSETSLQFFPEGGDLVTGMRSKVGFKAIGSDGLAKEISGNIVDEAGVVITEFQSNFLGMGSFFLIPEPGKSYKAIIGDNIVYSLPKAISQGVVMTVTNSVENSDIIVRIQASDEYRNKMFFLFGQTRGVFCYAAKIDLSSNLVIARIAKEKFPSGIAQITLLDDKNLPLVERLVFVGEFNPLSITVTSDKQVYKPREKITLSINVNDLYGKPVTSDLSLSVCDTQQVLIDENQETINSYLFLTSELIGNIEYPGYYFNSNNEDRHEALDHLLMTQGWRRFTFSKAIEAQWEKPMFKVEQGLTIKGTLVDKFNKKPIPDGKITFISFDPLPETKVVETDKFGYFELPHVIYFDSAQALLQGETKKGDKAVKFLVDSLPELPKNDFFIYPLNNTLNDFEKEFISRSVNRKKIDAAFNFDKSTTLLDAVEIIGKKQEKPGTVTKLYGSGTMSIQVAGNPGLENMLHPLQLLQGRIAGVQVNGSGLNWNVTIRGIGSVGGANTPLILVNNVQVQLSYLSQIPVRDIESYDVWKGPEAAIFGANGANGVIAFYTKEGKNYIPPREGIYKFTNIGFKGTREFYSPQYDIQKPEHAKPDERVTIFWDPLILTDSTGHATVSFYNHDLETEITGIIEGLSNNGLPGHLIFKYKVME
jgi:hypothetical protein